MNPLSWSNANLGQTHLYPDPPHGIDGQCVNSASSWSMYQGGPELFPGATAWIIYQSFRSGFYQVISGGNVQPGDIVFYPPNNKGEGTGPAGHVDVCIDQVTGSTFRAADSDYNGNLKLTYNVHNKSNVAGVFRPVKGNPMSIVDLSTARIFASTIGGLDGADGRPDALNGDVDADLNAHHVGLETNADVEIWYEANAQPGGYLRTIRPQVYADRDKYKAELNAQASPTVLKSGDYRVQ